MKLTDEEVIEILKEISEMETIQLQKTDIQALTEMRERIEKI